MVFRSSRIFVFLYVSETWTNARPETPAPETGAFKHPACGDAYPIAAAQDSLAERSKAVAQGAIPQGCGLEPHRRQSSALELPLFPLANLGL